MAATRSPGLLSVMSARRSAFFISPSNGSRVSAFSASFLTPALASISIALMRADLVSTSCVSTPCLFIALTALRRTPGFSSFNIACVRTFCIFGSSMLPRIRTGVTASNVNSISPVPLP